MPTFPEPMSTLESSIRRSVLSDSFEATSTLLDRYVKDVEARLQNSPAEVLVLHARVLKLFEWVGQMVQVTREEDLARAAHLQTLCGYRPAPDFQSQIHADA
jgi:hypothetical protein